ncbi:MAG: hypothetical protein KIC82_05245 [Acholeplasma sp.]|nr:hypothetical protein [Acholeplasma sp.]CCY27329.1 unknown [Acholeplasma sp. CAG:878]
MKKVLIFIALLCITGCDIKYDLSFKNEKIEEKIEVILPKKEKEKYDDLTKANPYAILDGLDQIEYNHKYKKLLTKNVGYYNYTYDFSDFGRAYYVRSCFDAVSFSKNDELGTYTLSTSNGFHCMFLNYEQVDNVLITITTDRYVLDNNADIVKGKKYIWRINNDNASNKSIKITFGDVRKRTIIDFIEENLPLVILISVLVVSLGGGFIILKSLSKKNNEL